MKLNADEKSILKAFESGQMKSVVKNNETLKSYQRSAQTTLRKNKRINIRLADSDLEAIKHTAVDEGIPYQSLISSILHKYNIGKLIEKR